MIKSFIDILNYLKISSCVFPTLGVQNLFSQDRAIIDQHGRLYIAVMILHLSIVAKKTQTNKQTKRFIAYGILYELIDLWVLDSNRRMGVWLLCMTLAHPLHPINSRSRIKRRNLWVGRCVSSWWPLFPSRNCVLIYIYLYVCILYTSSGYRTYIHIHRECRSVLVKMHPITVYRNGFGECAVPVLNVTCCFLYVGPLSGNRLLNNSWAVSLT